MSNDIVSMTIDKEAVQSVLEKRIQAAIVASLGHEDELIAKAVTMALRLKVSRSGTVSNYSSDNKYDLLEVLASNAIQEAAKEALQSWCQTNKEKIRNAVLKEMRKPGRVNSMAKAFADATEQSVTSTWATQINVSFSGQK